MAKPSLEFWRVWCGPKLWSHWLTSRDAAFQFAARHGLAYENEDGSIYLGPLTRIERGTRRYARSRTIPDSNPGAH